MTFQGPVDIKRLAAIDMNGLKGGPLRRNIITAEYVLGATAGPAIALLVMTTSESIGWTLFGAYVVGACLNYVPLAIHALLLLRQGSLEIELRGADIARELQHYTVTQLWIAMPLLFVISSGPQAFGRRPAH